MDDAIRELGVWYGRHLAADPAASKIRHRRCSDEVRRWGQMGPKTLGDPAAIHAFFPGWAPCVALCTMVRGLLQVVATGTLLKDEGGPCLVTALHALCDRAGRYIPHYADHGLMALSVNNQRLMLSGRQWLLYDPFDIAILPLNESEAAQMGGSLDIAHAFAPAKLWIAYGFPRSSNKQKHRRSPFSLAGLRMVLYDPAPLPSASCLHQEASFSLRYDRKQTFDPVTQRQQPGRSPKGCSGGLVAGYYPEFGCWLPKGIVTEWHEPDRALVATALHSVFAAR